MRRGMGGMGRIQKQQVKEEKFKVLGNEIAEDQINTLGEHMEIFRGYVKEFATKHKKEIQKNGEFRRQFQEMCANTGVDPLQSNSSFWTKMLGFGDFYYELGTQIVEVCMSINHINGGFINIRQLKSRVEASRNSSSEITTDDILRAIHKLVDLGGGIKLIKSHNTYIIQSIPTELSLDHNILLQLGQSNEGHIDADLVKSKLNWIDDRITKSINDLIMEGMVWIDNQAPGGLTLYWFQGLC